MDNNFNSTGFNPNNPPEPDDPGFRNLPLLNPGWFAPPPQVWPGMQDWAYPMGNPYQFAPFFPSHQDCVALEDNDEGDDLWQDDLTTASRPSEVPQVAVRPLVSSGTSTPIPQPSSAAELELLKEKAKASVRSRQAADQTKTLSADTMPPKPSTTLPKGPIPATTKPMTTGLNPPKAIGKSSFHKMTTVPGPTTKPKGAPVSEELSSAIDQLIEDVKKKPSTPRSVWTPQGRIAVSLPIPISGRSNQNKRQSTDRNSHKSQEQIENTNAIRSVSAVPSQKSSKVAPLKNLEIPTKTPGKFTDNIVSSPEEGEVIEDDSLPIDTTITSQLHVAESLGQQPNTSLVEKQSSADNNLKLTSATVPTRKPYDFDQNEAPPKPSAEADISTNKNDVSPMATAAKPPLVATNKAPEESSVVKDRALRDAPPLTNRSERRQKRYGQLNRDRSPKATDRPEEHERGYRERFDRDRSHVDPYRPKENFTRNRSYPSPEFQQRKPSYPDTGFRDRGNENRTEDERRERIERPPQKETRPYHQLSELPLRPKKETEEVPRSANKEMEIWLHSTGYYDEEYRSSHLSRYKKKIDLQKQLDDLEIEDATARRYAVNSANNPVIAPPVVPKQEVKQEPPSSPRKQLVAAKRPHHPDSDDDLPRRRVYPRRRSPSPRRYYESIRSADRGRGFSPPTGPYGSRGHPDDSSGVEWANSRYRGRNYIPHFNEKMARKASYIGNTRGHNPRGRGG